MKLKQLLAVLVFIAGITAMVLLSMSAANKSMAIGWYLFGMSVSTLILQLDAWYLESQIINGKWKGGQA